MLKITNGRDLFYQWDIGQSLTVTLAEGETVTAVHIGNNEKDRDGFYVVEPINGIVAVYDELLQNGQRVVAYEYVESATEGHTVRKYVFNVAKRPKADNYSYTPTTSYSWEYWCERARLYAVAAEGSKNSAAASVSSIPATMTAWWNAHRSEFKGDAGANGQDGYSPTATVSKVGTTSTITITDKNGTTTASVVDGETQDLTDYVKNTDLANEQRRIDYLYMVNEGITYNWETDDDEAYVKNVPSGAVQMGVNKIGGKSVVVNQLVNTTVKTTTLNGVTFTRNEDGSYTANGTATSNAYLTAEPDFTSKCVVGHKYYITGVTGGSAATYRIRFFGGYVELAEPRVYTLAQSAYDDASKGLELRVYSGATVNNLVFKPQVFDLTQMYGSGSEPSLEECKKIFTEDYYPYNTGELISASSKKIVSKGRNLWNEQTESGAIDSTGTPYDNTNRIRANGYIEVEPSTSYYLYCGKLVGTSTANIFGFWYDKDKTPIKYDGTNVVVNACNTNIGSPSNAKYFRFFLGGAYGMTYLNDTAFIKGTSGTYTPYKEPTELTTDYGVLRSAGSVYDYVDLDRGVLVRRVGTVDLGSLSYGKYDITQGTMFRTTIASMVDVYDNLNLVCAKYTTTKDSARVNGGISQTTNSQIDIVDSSYTDTTSFKSAMNGVKLFYELATPTEEPITVKGNTLDIESGGTITFVADVTDYHIPVPSEETYMVKVSEV